MSAPSREAAASVREDHPWTPPNINNDDDVQRLLDGGDFLTISSNNGFHVLVKRMNFSLMVYGETPKKREKRFRDDGTPTRWITADPTADRAINHLIRGGGPFSITAANNFEITVSREHMASMCIGMTSREARPRKNRQGKFRRYIWLEPIHSKNETPTEIATKQSLGEGPNIQIT
ncbi:hypothetical protein ACWGOE_01710 [Leucobacter chromiiresistens]